MWLQWSSCHHHLHHTLLQWTPACPGSPGKWSLKWRVSINTDFVNLALKLTTLACEIRKSYFSSLSGVVFRRIGWLNKSPKSFAKSAVVYPIRLLCYLCSTSVKLQKNNWTNTEQISVHTCSHFNLVTLTFDLSEIPTHNKKHQYHLFW